MGDASKTSARHVVRGGSWINNGRNLRSAYRNWNDPGNRNNNLGFRLSPAQHVVGMGMNDQIIIQFCVKLIQTKSKVASALVAAHAVPESPLVYRFA